MRKKLSFKDAGKDLADPFYETAENQNLIGVANLFLGVLFHDVALSYQTPIISQQGEVPSHSKIPLLTYFKHCLDTPIQRNLRTRYLVVCVSRLSACQEVFQS